MRLSLIKVQIRQEIEMRKRCRKTYGDKGIWSLCAMTRSSMSAETKKDIMTLGVFLQSEIPISCARWSICTSSNAAGNSTLSELEDSMNPLHKARQMKESVLVYRPKDI